MNKIKTVPISEARKRIFELIKEVQCPGSYCVLNQKGVPVAVLMSAEEFDSWLETFDTVVEIPDLGKDVMKFEKDKKSGKATGYPKLIDVLARQGFVVSDGDVKYGVSNSNIPKSRKKPGKIASKA